MRARIALGAWVLLTWTGAASALGLGEIEVASRLNEPLRAVIPITSGTVQEMDSLVVELASNEEFERAGLDRAEFLSTVRFEVKDRAIHVRSKNIAREPFVSFLVDLRWTGGRLLREYTVLLDPPSPTRANAPAPRYESAPAPVPMMPGAVTAPAAPAPAPAPSAAPPAPQEAAPPAATGEASTPPPRAAAPSAAPVAPMASSSDRRYGPIQPQETLWSVAYRLRPDTSLTMDQMQVALFRANPQAFDDGKLTGLMKGATLVVPTASEIGAIDAQEARSIVSAANRGIPVAQAPLRQGAAPRAPRPTVTPQPKPAPVPVPVPAPVEIKPEPTPAPAPTPPPAPETAAPAPAPAPSAPIATTPAPEATPPTAEGAAPPTTPAPEATAPTAPATTPEPVATTPAPAPEAAPVQTTPAPEAAPAPAEEEEGLVGELLGKLGGIVSQPWFPIAIAGLFVIGAATFGFRKLRNKLAERAYKRATGKREPEAEPEVAPTFEEAPTMLAPTAAAAPQRSVLSELEAASVDDATQVNTGGMQATQAMQSSTMQQTMQQTHAQTQSMSTTMGGPKIDFDVTGKFAEETVQINLDAGDPVSEAEFHRAYGLYDEAALLLKQALQKDPKRSDARVKLAEIYFEASRGSDFVQTARELKGQVPDAEWQKIALMGSQIAPNDELFKGASAGVGAVDLSFDEPAAPSAPAAPAAVPAPAPAPAAAAPAAGGDMLDFKLDELQLPETPGGAAPTPSAPAEGALEFDLGGLSLDTPAAPAPAPAAAAPSAPAGDAMDLSGFDLKLDEGAPAEPAPVEMGAEPSLAEAAPADAGLGMDLASPEVAFEDVPAAGGDEASTKLDLARAYMDMGDNDMAKSLLGEVMQQGSAQQKKEAQELLQRVPA